MPPVPTPRTYEEGQRNTPKSIISYYKHKEAIEREKTQWASAIKTGIYVGAVQSKLLQDGRSYRGGWELKKARTSHLPLRTFLSGLQSFCSLSPRAQRESPRTTQKADIRD